MIPFLARHEWRVLTASAVVLWVIAIFGIALVAASALGAARAAREQQTFEAFAARTSQQLARTSSVRADVAANDKGWLALVPPAAARRAGRGPERRVSRLPQGDRQKSRCGGQRRSDRASTGGGIGTFRRRVRGAVPLSAADLRRQFRPDRHRTRSRHAAHGAGASGAARRRGGGEDDRESSDAGAAGDPHSRGGDVGDGWRCSERRC